MMYSRRTLLIGLASAAVAPALPALGHGIRAGEGVIGQLRGPINCRCTTTHLYAYQRHILAWLDGEDNDPATGLPHLAHAAFLSMYASK